MAISPWHIMLSRWGLESNLAPAFLLFGFYFFVKGVKNNKYWMLSALMYGTALYAYSITWVVVPVCILFMGLYIILSKQKISIKYTAISAGILFILALPLILFMLVNSGYMEEIRTSFFSVPKLVVMRESDISIENLMSPEIRENFFNLYWGENDNLIWNSTEQFGLFFKITSPFAILGFVRLLVGAILKLKKKEFSYSMLVVISTLCTFISCLTLTNVNVNRINSIHIFTAILITIGIYAIYEIAALLSDSNKTAKYTLYTIFALILLYSANSFYSFSNYYFNDYNEQIAPHFKDGVGEAVEYINEHDYEKICVDSVQHPQILFYDKTPTPEYIKTVEYANYPSAYMSTKSFTKYTFGLTGQTNLNEYDAFIIREANINYMKYHGFKIVKFGQYAVAHK